MCAGRGWAGLLLVALTATGGSIDAQAPEWRRACNPSPFLIGAPGSGGRGSVPATATAGPTLDELAGIRPITVPDNVDLARCFYLNNNPTGALASATRALETLRAEPISALATRPGALPLAGRDVPRPAKTRDIPPLHPSDYAEVGIVGVVFIDAVVDREGRVKDPVIGASIPALDRYALDAVRQWRYAPTIVDGKPADVAITLLVGFGPDAGNQPVNALDAARFFHARQQRVDAEGWLSRAVDLLRAEESDWRAFSPTTRRGGPPADTSLPPRTVIPPTKVADVRPVFPRLAKAARIQGVTIIEAVIGKDGNVHRARILRSEPILAYAALRAVKQWKYTPALVDGTPTDIIMTVTVNFALN